MSKSERWLVMAIKYKALSIDILPLPGLETEIAVTGICVSPDCNNGMLVMYYDTSKVHECMAHLSKMTKTIIRAHSRRYYVSPHQISGRSVAWPGRRMYQK